MIRQCQLCNKDFITYHSKVIIGRGKYCSKVCSNEVTLIKKGQHIGVCTQFGNIIPHNKKGWRYTFAGGNRNRYKEIYNPEHPNRTKSGYVREHRLVVENKLGRYLDKSEIVHHLNGDTLDNNLNNLEVMLKVEHDRLNTKLNIHRRWNA